MSSACSCERVATPHSIMRLPSELCAGERQCVCVCVFKTGELRVPFDEGLPSKNLGAVPHTRTDH